MAIKNLGPYDQKLALQWVQDNSEFFNCDKSKVTRPIFWSVSAELIYRQKNPVASFFKRRMSITYYMLDVDTTLFSGALWGVTIDGDITRAAARRNFLGTVIAKGVDAWSFLFISSTPRVLHGKDGATLLKSLLS
ncbi:hypothetical protein H2248_010441 [Termitomyces sp. 'cryptogamus']|nr:hypothetical protein H2248_010441 [Termitomyces sp. 'cryptogamus']